MIDGTGWVGVQGSPAGGFWRTDGTSTGTIKELADTTLAPRFLQPVGSTIWFCGDNGSPWPAPMAYDTVSDQVDPKGDIACGLPYGGWAEITQLGTRVLLIASGESDGGEVWAIDNDS